MMAPSREERFLMRQRGAGARQLRNSVFDLAIPGVSVPSSKTIGSGRSRRTPQPILQAQRSSKRTPKAPSLPAQPSSRHTPATVVLQVSGPRQGGAEISSRNQSDVSGLRHLHIQSKSSTKRKQKRKTLSRDAELSTPVGVDSIPETQEAPEKPINSDIPGDGKASFHVVDTQLDTSAGVSSKKRKKRRSIGQNSRKRIKTGIPADTRLAPSVLPLATSTIPEPSEERAKTSSPDPDHDEPVLDMVPQIELATKRKRKKRKSITKSPRLKRRPLQILSLTDQNLEIAAGKDLSAMAPVRGKAGEDVVLAEEFEGESELEPSLNREKQTGKGLQSGLSSSSQPRKRGRPKKSDIARHNLPGQAAIKQSTSHSKSSQAAVHLAPFSSTKHGEKTIPRARPNSIPITVHRLNHLSIGDPSSAEDDILSCLPTFPNRSSVNAIDVLSQICREVVGKTVESLQLAEAKEPGERQGVEQHKRGVIELYGSELDARLFQMTEALDNNYALTVRLRRAKKEKLALGLRLLEIKRQREETTIDTGKVRARHDRITQIAQSEDDLHTLIDDLELAVQRGRAQKQTSGKQHDKEEEKGLDLSLQSAAEKVSSVGRLGLLEKVKGFNALVETVIASI